MRLAAALVAAGLLAGCGGGGGDRLVVSAASSLKDPFTDYARDFDTDVALQFAGSTSSLASIVIIASVAAGFFVTLTRRNWFGPTVAMEG